MTLVVHSALSLYESILKFCVSIVSHLQQQSYSAGRKCVLICMPRDVDRKNTFLNRQMFRTHVLMIVMLLQLFVVMLLLLVVVLVMVLLLLSVVVVLVILLLLVVVLVMLLLLLAVLVMLLS